MENSVMSPIDDKQKNTEDTTMSQQDGKRFNAQDKDRVISMTRELIRRWRPGRSRARQEA